MKLIECPRDAMQGLPGFIPTQTKIEYLNQLLRVGFDTLDFGSFVSPEAIPQMRDTAEVLAGLDLSQTNTRLLAIVANRRGAETACTFPEIAYLGYPLSISETFQRRNTHRGIAESLALVAEIQAMSQMAGKALVTYISMGFGNPYGDPYNREIVLDFAQKLADMGVRIIALADTIGASNPENIHFLFSTLIPAFPTVEFGAHLHSTPQSVVEKLEAALAAGCCRFDGAFLGFGGCPMARDELVGNMPMEQMCYFLQQKGFDLGVNPTAFRKSLELAQSVFLGNEAH
ncbi:MAG: hydroxymethylglutaryl-CoA lyase [Microscillaceae bacterium]|nr:hydroxymethylglutaryl-CoA lyase [Microscillaceae bacterium]